MKKIKVSELPLWNDLKGLVVMGVNSLNQSVKVSLEFIKEHTDAAIAAATTATNNAITATANAVKAKQDCDAAVVANNTATTNAISAMNTATTAAVSRADTATAKANTATTAANTAKANADTATANANAATAKANTAATNADKATEAAQQATDEANDATTHAEGAAFEAEQAAGRADAAKDDVIAALARVVPSYLVVTAPESLTLSDNVAALACIGAQLFPEGVMQNLVFISDNKAVAVDAQGNLRPVAEGESVVHVVPTCNTALTRTLLIKVHRPYVRKVSPTAIRLTASGNFRFN